jgi:hypothetical protein
MQHTVIMHTTQESNLQAMPAHAALIHDVNRNSAWIKSDGFGDADRILRGITAGNQCYWPILPL